MNSFSATTAAAAPYSTDLVTSYTNDSGRLNNIDDRPERKRNHVLTNNNKARVVTSDASDHRPNSKNGKSKQLTITNSNKAGASMFLSFLNS